MAIEEFHPVPPGASFLDGIEPVELPFAESDGIVVACGRVADHTDSLLAPERTGLGRMREVRAAEYSSGRRVARHALGAIGIPGWPIVARGRSPVWPAEVVGSITHSRTLALAAVGWRRRFVGLGVDLEVEGRVTPRLAGRVLLERERRQMTEADSPTMLFSAKEAVYKAVNPTAGEYLGFEDVEVTISLDGTFLAKTTRPCASESLVAVGGGFYQRIEGHWLSAFLVAAGAVA